MTTHQRPTSSLINPAFLHLLLVLLLSWAGMPLAIAAGEIQVDSAKPSTAEQGTNDLDVTIKGNGFGTDSQVDFFLAGTMNSGGITVNTVKLKGPKQLTATIDIDVDAEIADFDIHVISNGFTDWGAGLFTVTEETGGGGPPPGGQDTIPPGAVTDLSLDGQTGFNTIPVTWTATANDGYEASSGPARLYVFRYSLDEALTEAEWDTYNRVDNGGEWGKVPGTLQSVVLADRKFEPDTTYFIGVRATDFADNASLVSNIEVTTGPFPTSTWGEELVDSCPWYNHDFDYDSSGNPAIVYDERCSGSLVTKIAQWNGTSFETAIIDARIDGNGDKFFAFDPDTGDPTLVGYGKGGKMYFYRRVGSSWSAELIERGNTHGAIFAYSNEVPAVAHLAYGISARNGDGSCWLVRLNGGAWEKAVVDPSTACKNPQLAFDYAGNPALAYRDNLLVEPVYDFYDTLKIAVWDPDAAEWIVEIVDQNPGYQVNTPNLAYDPIRPGFSVTYERELITTWPDGRIEFGPGELWSCDLTATNWSCEVGEGGDGGRALTYGTDGTAYFVYGTLYSFGVAIRAPGSVEWVKELVDWGAEGPSLKLEPGGIPGILYDRHRSSNLDHPHGKSLNFARPIP